ncbi:MAG TPA: GNAT family N-acetyltransferase [Alphaproteobacteria bacterium]|nr:GNAT family N-acetyltransferase [Alphaproteobacteria bacterium]
MAVTLKRMAPADEPRFARVAPEVFDEPIHAERLRAYLRAPGHLLILAFEGDVVVGQCAAVVHHHPDKPIELYVDEVGTASTHRRQGVATAMLAEMFAWGRELGCTEAWLGTEPGNAEANGLYRGFAPAEDEPMQSYLFKL